MAGEPKRVGCVWFSRVGAAGYLGLDTVLYQHLGVFHALPERLSTLLILFVVGIRYPLLTEVSRRHDAPSCGAAWQPNTSQVFKKSSTAVPKLRCPDTVFNTRAREALACA